MEKKIWFLFSLTWCTQTKTENNNKNSMDILN